MTQSRHTITLPGIEVMREQLKPFFKAHESLTWLEPHLLRLADQSISPTGLAGKLWRLIDHACGQQGVPSPLILRLIPAELIPLLAVNCSRQSSRGEFTAIARDAYATLERRSRKQARADSEPSQRARSVPKKDPRPPRLPGRRTLSSMELSREEWQRKHSQTGQKPRKGNRHDR